MAARYQYRDDEETLERDVPSLTDDEIETEDEDNTLHVSSTGQSPKNASRLPVWMRESAQSFRFPWIPPSAQKAGRAIAEWVKGPTPPKELKIKPIFPFIQEAPIRLMDRYLFRRKHRIYLLIAFYLSWLLVWGLMLRHNAGSSRIEGYGEPTNIWCGASFWNDGNGCDLNGNGCRPFSSANMAFRCPGNCMGTMLQEERVVGNTTVIYQGLVVGGPDPEKPGSMAIYRADSFICQAAIHAGVVDKTTGGCGVATLIGENTNFKSSKSRGVESIAFPATFPRSYTFQALSGPQAQCPKDSRWSLFAVTAVALVVLSLFTISPAVFFYSTFIIMMLQVGLVSDPPNKSNMHELISTLVGRLLPATFVATVLYRFCTVPLLDGLTAQVEKTVLYLGACFFGALNNYTFAAIIPIQRLTAHDLRQPGAPFALAIILTIIISIVIGQIHFIRISGNMPKYLTIYAVFVAGLLVLLALPGLDLRIHHYILALLFMPGTGFQTRPGLIYQGLLLGLFINGVARWGFASIIQTPAALYLPDNGGGGDGGWWGATAPNVTAVVASETANITFHWGSLPLSTGVDGVSILINDVERWRGYTDEELYWDPEQVTLTRRKRERHEPEFFRFAWMNGNDVGRYSRVGIWDREGVWQDVR